jgi:hypothetical protein
MSGTAHPYGAVPIGTLSSAGSFTGRTRQIGIASGFATSIFYGDFVKLVTTGVVELDTGTATLTPVGIFLGCSYTDPNSSQKVFTQHWTASVVASDAVAYILDDPFVLFQMQGDATLAVTARGANASVVQTAGNTTFGKSKNAFDSSSINSTNTLPLRLIDFVDGPDSAIGDAYTDVICMFNVGHAYLNTTGLA